MSKNVTYQRLVKYIKENKNNISKENLIFILNYAAALKEQNIENAKQCNVKEIIKDLIKLNKIIKSGEQTIITYQRLEKELKLFEDILNGQNLEKISYELDKMYIENDLGVRSNSTLINTLLTQNYITETNETK